MRSRLTPDVPISPVRPKTGRSSGHTVTKLDLHAIRSRHQTNTPIRPARDWQRKIRWPANKTVTMLLIGISCLTFIYYITHSTAPKQTTESKVNTPQETQQGGSLVKGAPTYKTYLPLGRTIETLGGWTRVSPANRDPVFAYADSITNIPIIVSQQPIPKTFHPDIADQVENLAKDYGASRFITIDGSKVYMGVSAKGPQSIIFTKNETLILIKASATLADDALTSYIMSLK